jgi:hypothetical protein
MFNLNSIQLIALLVLISRISCVELVLSSSAERVTQHFCYRICCATRSLAHSTQSAKCLRFACNRSDITSEAVRWWWHKGRQTNLQATFFLCPTLFRSLSLSFALFHSPSFLPPSLSLSLSLSLSFTRPFAATFTFTPNTNSTPNFKVVNLLSCVDRTTKAVRDTKRPDPSYCATHASHRTQLRVLQLHLSTKDTHDRRFEQVSESSAD